MTIRAPELGRGTGSQTLGQGVALAAGRTRDKATVLAALSPPWSTGLTEGPVTGLQRLKRQRSGRAQFDLLRQRILHVS